LEKKSFFLGADKLRAVEKDGGGEIEFYTDYEDIRRQTRKYYKRRPGALFCAIFCALVALFHIVTSLFTDWQIFWTVLCLSLAAVFAAMHLLTRRHYIIIDLYGDRCLFLFASSPSSEAVTEFLEDLYRRRDDYLRENYLYINPDNDRRTEMSRLKWLLREGVITDREYESALDEYDNKRLF